MGYRTNRFAVTRIDILAGTRKQNKRKTFDPTLLVWKPPSKAKPVDTLTPRQREIGKLLAEGLTNRQIAETFGSSVETVKSQVYQMFDKLGVDTRLEAALFFMDKETKNRELILQQELEDTKRQLEDLKEKYQREVEDIKLLVSAAHAMKLTPPSVETQL